MASIRQMKRNIVRKQVGNEKLQTEWFYLQLRTKRLSKKEDK